MVSNLRSASCPSCCACSQSCMRTRPLLNHGEALVGKLCGCGSAAGRTRACRTAWPRPLAAPRRQSHPRTALHLRHRQQLRGRRRAAARREHCPACCCASCWRSYAVSGGRSSSSAPAATRCSATLRRCRSILGARWTRPAGFSRSKGQICLWLPKLRTHKGVEHVSLLSEVKSHKL